VSAILDRLVTYERLRRALQKHTQCSWKISLRVLQLVVAKHETAHQAPVQVH
jgi:hypothetical protein